MYYYVGETGGHLARQVGVRAELRGDVVRGRGVEVRARVQPHVAFCQPRPTTGLATRQHCKRNIVLHSGYRIDSFWGSKSYEVSCFLCFVT